MDTNRKALMQRAGAGLAGAVLLAVLLFTTSSSQTSSLCGVAVDCSSGDLSHYDTLMYDHQGNGSWDDVSLKQFLSKGNGMSISKGVMTWLPQTAPNGHLESQKMVSLVASRSRYNCHPGTGPDNRRDRDQHRRRQP